MDTGLLTLVLLIVALQGFALVGWLRPPNRITYKGRRML